MRYPTMTVNIERIDKLAEIALCHAEAANPTLQLQPEKALDSLRCLHSSHTKQYVISQFEVRESEI
jgi:hypothetical protein